MTDKAAYMKIVEAANNGDKKAKEFIHDLGKWMYNSAGSYRLHLIDDLSKDANKIVYSMRDEAIKREEESKKSYKF